MLFWYIPPEGVRKIPAPSVVVAPHRGIAVHDLAAVQPDVEVSRRAEAPLHDDVMHDSVARARLRVVRLCCSGCVTRVDDQVPPAERDA